MKDFLLSVVIGDMCGVPYEPRRFRTKDPTKIDLDSPFQRFSDDSVCTFAVADYFLSDKSRSLSDVLRDYCNREPRAGYGGMFRKWLATPEMGAYGSWGNGSAMRVSSASILSSSEGECIDMAVESCEPTHNHPKAIEGATITAIIGYRLLHGAGKECAERYLKDLYKDFDVPYNELRGWYNFRSSAHETVPAAIVAFLESDSFEDCIIKCIALGGDSDTLCAIACPWAYAYYKEMPEYLIDRAKSKMSAWMLEINDKVNEKIEER